MSLWVYLPMDKPLTPLKLALKNAKHDTTRCNILNAMVEAEGDDNVWPKYNEQLKVLSEKNIAAKAEPKIFYLKHLAATFNNIGYLAYKIKARSPRHWSIIAKVYKDS